MTELNTAICSHLLPFLEKLKAKGSNVVRVEEGWSNCALNITLDQGPSITLAEEMFAISDGVRLWHNDDGHYAIENGLFCDQCKHSLSWPRAKHEIIRW